MAETIWWCEVHGYQSFDGEDGSSCEDGVWLEGRGGWNCRDWCVMTDLDPCRRVERVLSVPGELVDPANVDYEAARRVMRSWLVEDNDAPLLSAVRVAVDAALGVGEPAEGNGE